MTKAAAATDKFAVVLWPLSYYITHNLFPFCSFSSVLFLFLYKEIIFFWVRSHLPITRIAMLQQSSQFLLPMMISTIPFLCSFLFFFFFLAWLCIYVCSNYTYVNINEFTSGNIYKWLVKSLNMLVLKILHKVTHVIELLLSTKIE